MTYDEIATVRGDVLINTTSVGMYPSVDESPVAEEIIINFATLIDIIYNPRVTKFLEIGRRLDKKICGGLEMLVGQAIKAEEIWQEREISHEILTKVMDDFDKKFQ